MSGADSRSNRRQFFRGAVGAGTLAGLGLNLNRRGRPRRS